MYTHGAKKQKVKFAKQMEAYKGDDKNKRSRRW